MRFPRSSGVLLHPTSLPGRFGIGDLGPQAHEFVDFLAETGQRWWQMLPLGPTGGMNSPYQSHSSFAGNPLLISPEGLVAEGVLAAADLKLMGRGSRTKVDFATVAREKNELLRLACAAVPPDDSRFQQFEAANASWLDDYALFMAIKGATNDKAWFQWERGLVSRQAKALDQWREKLAAEVHYHKFVQYVFAFQMENLRAYCLNHQVNMIGDIPIFVAHDSADVWARPDLFFLDAKGQTTVQAGVPPDLFSRTGQLWGNPLYNWEVHEEEGFAWWIDRIGALLKWVDLIRIDHFRGLEAYWEVPGKAKTAAKGRWVQSPGVAFFKALEQRFLDLPLIAEDLGVITPEVEALREQFGLPGMRILQFGFSLSASEEKHLPHRFVPHCVVYTGTHDNDTSRGWLHSKNVHTTQSAEEIQGERRYALRYAQSDGKEFHWDLIRLAMESVANVAIIPMQDLLGLDSSARMNVPGVARGNWDWRFQADQLDGKVKARLAELTAIYSRWNGAIPHALDPHHMPDGSSKKAVASGRAKRARSEPSPNGMDAAAVRKSASGKKARKGS